jgi:uncharacterized phage protein (TIGR02220 family)
MEKCKDYFIILPSYIRHDKNLKPSEKLIFGEILALSQKEGYCWANNSYFAEIYDVSNSTVSKWINNLISFGYIRSELIYKDDSKEIEKRKIFVNDVDLIAIDKKINTAIDQNLNTPIEENIHSSMEENLKDNKQDINKQDINTNTSEFNQLSISLGNNKNNKYLKARAELEATEHVVKYLNSVCNTSFRPNVSATKKLVSKRLKEGFSLQDFEKVIEWKYSQWGEHPKVFNNGMMSNNFLRPDVLFGDKFESYLYEANQNIKAKEGPKQVDINSLKILQTFR